MKTSPNNEDWHVPSYKRNIFFPKKTKYCLCIPVINEGKRLLRQLQQLKPLTSKIDIIITDGGSTDGSTDSSQLKSLGVRALLVKQEAGRLSSQLRIGYAWALQQGYEGIVTIDGNGKDDVSEIPHFVKALDDSYDYVQGSRFIKGGRAVRTPLLRYWAIRLIHAPVLSLAAGHWLTDTTNGFRAYSRRYLLHPSVQPFRSIFRKYELLAYLSVRAPQLGLKVVEIPVSRTYPKGKIPTKITSLGAYFDLVQTILATLFRRYHPSSSANKIS